MKLFSIFHSEKILMQPRSSGTWNIGRENAFASIDLNVYKSEKSLGMPRSGGFVVAATYHYFDFTT